MARARFQALAFAAAFFAVAEGCRSPEQEVRAGTLTIPVVGRVKGLDPAFADEAAVAAQVGNAYEGLFQYHYLKRPYQLIPNLAEGMPEESADGLTLVFKLKKGVLFQDDPCFKQTQGKGRELTADDVVYSLLRLADPAVQSTGRWIFEGKVAGLKAMDRYTVQLRLTRKVPRFLSYLAMPFTYIVPKEAVEHYGRDFALKAVGTGPFRLKEFRGNERIVWERNPTYRSEAYPADGTREDKDAGLLADAGKPLPLASRLVISISEGSLPHWESFLARTTDLTEIPNDRFHEAVSAGELVPSLSEKGIQLRKEPSLDVTHLSFNMADPLLGRNKPLRQALSLAASAESEKYIELFYNGRAAPAHGPIPPGLAGHDPAMKNPYRVSDLKRAKLLLAKAGYPGGRGLPPLAYATLTDGIHRQMADHDERSFSAIGVKLKITPHSRAEFQSVVRTGKSQIWPLAWKADYPDAENFLQLFYSKNVSPGPNDSNYSNPRFDRLYEEALALPEGRARSELYREMVALVIEDCPWVFGVHRVNFTLLQPWVRNFKQHELENTRMKYLGVSDGEREAARK